MPVREFIDARGEKWTVWSTVADWRAGLAARFHDGWLTFQSRHERRRLAPIPRAWEDAADARLSQMCELAEVVETDRAARDRDRDAAP